MPAIVNFLTPSPGPNIIEVIDTGGDNEIDVLEIFSEWKDWLLADAGPRLGYPQAFTVIGGEPKSPTLDLGQAFFLHPEWKIRPAERDHRLVINGDIQVLGGVGRLTVPTVGAFTVEVSFNTSALITGLNLSNPLSAAQTAAAVWDVADSLHVAVGSKGQVLSLASTASALAAVAAQLAKAADLLGVTGKVVEHKRPILGGANGHQRVPANGAEIDIAVKQIDADTVRLNDP